MSDETFPDFSQPRSMPLVSLATATQLLKSGQLVAIPTETVYGLAADARDPVAIAQIFTTKNRPADNPLIVHVADPSRIPRFAAIPTALDQVLLDTFFPGPLTLLLPKRSPQKISKNFPSPDLIPDATTAGSPLVAVRAPTQPHTQKLLQTLNFPLAAPSANRSGRPSPTSPAMVFENFWKNFPVLDGGFSTLGLESTVAQVSDGEILVHRPGAITPADLTTATGAPARFSTPTTNASPGTRHPHYSPSFTRVERLPADFSPQTFPNFPKKSFTDSPEKIGIFASRARFLEHFPAFSSTISATAPGTKLSLKIWNFSISARHRADDLGLAARFLFQVFHAADQHQLPRLFLQKIPAEGLGAALVNRIEKARGN